MKPLPYGEIQLGSVKNYLATGQPSAYRKGRRRGCILAASIITDWHTSTGFKFRP